MRTFTKQIALLFFIIAFAISLKANESYYSLDSCPTPTISVAGNTMTASPADSYQWYLNGVAIQNATSATYKAVENGTYKVKTTFSSGCTNFSDDKHLAATNTFDVDFNASVSVYPNPASSEVHIQLPAASNVDGIHIEFYNSNGTILSTSTFHGDRNLVLNVGSYPAGVYTLIIRSDDWVVSKRIVKE